ncbi:MAG: DMT family transporter [Halofilum sp. (in: g-proteobacteria)]|nr:DMT family transporter [Halofilum sp. (in: g-proteobacteria)]
MAQHSVDPPAPALTARPDGRPLAGIAWMALGVSTLPLMDAIAKYLSAEYHVLHVTWARYGFHLLLLLALLAWRLRPAELVPRHPGLQVLRSGFLLGTTLCYFGAISYLPLANVLALAFIGPIVSTALAPVFLGEHVGRRRWTAVLVGFLGALIVIRPGFGVFHPASLLALGAGLFYGAYQVATRRLSGSGRPLVTLLYTAVLGVAVLTLALPWVWTTPDTAAWAWMAAMGLFGALAHFFIIHAFEHASAPVLAPVSYVEIVAAAAIGWIVFGDFPDYWTWLGVGVIIVSGSYISLREGRRRARP